VASHDRGFLIGTLERSWNQVASVPLDERLISMAGDIAERLGLRAYDSIHLAAASRMAGIGPFVFACWDNELRSAARILGFALLPS
jgi:predicted nucleic acid-binding protein